MNRKDCVVQKDVDYSLLINGLTLPKFANKIFGTVNGYGLKRGETRPIKLLLEGVSYDAKVVNINNSVQRRPEDAFQIRYSENSEVAKAIQGYFSNSYNYIMKEREILKKTLPKGKRIHVPVPEDMREYLIIYPTDDEDVFVLETLTKGEISSLQDQLKDKDEMLAETMLYTDVFDKTATIEEKQRLVKVRKTNRAICDGLKSLYDYRCQICGEKIGDEFGIEISEAHHIEYFSKSMNNDQNNVMIVCPNHHRIIHKANLEFERKTLTYKFDGGHIPLKLNRHLTKDYVSK